MTASAPAADRLSLTGRVALVTGAGQGVGAATADALAAAGATVVVNDVHLDRAETTAATIVDRGGHAIALRADVTDPEAVEALVAAATRDAGPVDVLVNNAGNAGAESDPLARPRPFWETGPDDWRPWLAVNLDGVMLMTRAVLRGMVERGHGRVVTVISDAGRVGEPGLVAYSAAKAGAAGFTRAIARAVGGQGVTANCVALGTVRTPALEPLLADKTLATRMRRAYPVGRIGEPEDPAGLIAFLASDAASWITGQTYPVNGGFSVAL